MTFAVNVFLLGHYTMYTHNRHYTDYMAMGNCQHTILRCMHAIYVCQEFYSNGYLAIWHSAS